jgi:ATP-binding cassette subfamily C protein
MTLGRTRTSAAEKVGPAPSGATLRRYVLALLTHMRWRAVGVFFLLLAVGLTEGVGLLALVPLLHVLGLTPDGGAGSPVATAAVRAFAAIGLPFNLPSLLGAFLILVVFRAVLTRARDLQLTEVRFGFVDHLRTGLYAAIGRADWLLLARMRTSDFRILDRPPYESADPVQTIIDAITHVQHHDVVFERGSDLLLNARDD